MNERTVSRRVFILSSGASILASTVLGRQPSLKRLGYKSPNEKLNIAGIGAGGKGATDIEQCSHENIVALCDPDWNNAAKTFDKYSKAQRYKDFRVMLDQEKNIDVRRNMVQEIVASFQALAVRPHPAKTNLTVTGEIGLTFL